MQFAAPAFGSPSGAAESRKGNLKTTLLYCYVSCFQMLCCGSTLNLLPISSPCKSVRAHPDTLCTTAIVMEIYSITYSALTSWCHSTPRINNWFAHLWKQCQAGEVFANFMLCVPYLSGSQRKFVHSIKHRGCNDRSMPFFKVVIQPRTSSKLYRLIPEQAFLLFKIFKHLVFPTMNGFLH